MLQTRHELDVAFSAFDEVVTTLPSTSATLETKAYLIDFILKVAAEGHTDRNEIVTRSLSYIHEVILFLMA
jgi:hypothetical protein